jgi:hypothetical protein
MSLFQLAAPCPLFQPASGFSDYATIQFVRAAHLVAASNITVNAAGETVLSFIPVGSYTGELQPAPAGLVRLIHGVVDKVDWRFVVLGMPDIQDGDRAYIAGKQVEVVTAAQWGVEHLEAELKYIGR